MTDSDSHIGLEAVGSGKVACMRSELHSYCSAVDSVGSVGLPKISSGDSSSLGCMSLLSSQNYKQH